MKEVVQRESGLLAAYATLLIFLVYGTELIGDFASVLLPLLLFVWLFGIMLWCALCVVRHADGLADLLGEPYGTLILTLSVIGIEVALISAVMLSGDTNPTLARDTMFAVLMIVLNGLVGVALLVGAFYHREQYYNLHGATAFLSVIIPLSAFSLVLPRFTITTEEPTFSPSQAIVFSALIILLYGCFLMIQTVRHATYFMEPQVAEGRKASTGRHREKTEQAVEEPKAHGSADYSVLMHAVLLALFLLPIVLLSKKLAVFIDHGIEEMMLPTALGGVVIAALVLSAEGMSAVRAAFRDQLQRAVNICLGSALSTIGLTAPAVLAISLFTGVPVQLGLEGAELILLMLTLVNCILTFRGTQTNVLQGMVHLVLFVSYLALVLVP